MKSKKTGLKRGLAALILSIFVFSLCATAIANTWAGKINSFLGTSSYKVEKTGDSTTDGIYFKSEFTDLKQVVDAKQALAIEIAQEGTVLFKNNGALPLSGDGVTVWGLNAIAPTFGGLIGSTVSVAPDAGQNTITLIDALKDKGVAVNDAMISLYQSEKAAAYYRKAAFFGQEVPGHSLIPSFFPMYDTKLQLKHLKIQSRNVTLRMSSSVKEQIVAQRRSTTFLSVGKTSFRNPIRRSSRQICSIGFISGVYGGI